MAREVEEERTDEIAPPSLDAVQEVNEHPVMVSVTFDEYLTEIAPPFPSLHEQLLNVIPESVRFELTDVNSNIDPFPVFRTMSEKTILLQFAELWLHGVKEIRGVEVNTMCDTFTPLSVTLPFPRLTILHPNFTESDDVIFISVKHTLPVPLTITIPYPFLLDKTISILEIESFPVLTSNAYPKFVSFNASLISNVTSLSPSLSIDIWQLPISTYVVSILCVPAINVIEFDLFSS